MLPETSSQEPKVKEGSSQKKPAKKRSTKSKERGQATVSSPGSELEKLTPLGLIKFMIKMEKFTCCQNRLADLVPLVLVG